MIQNKAMLAQCSVRRWNPRVLDRKVSAEVVKLHNAAADAGDYRKMLVDKAHIKALNTSAGLIRKLHYSLTLPWDDEGDRLLPSKTFQKYSDEMRVLKDADELLRQDLYRIYPQLLATAPARLGTMYDPADFPNPADLPAKFDIKLAFKPVPSAADFRLDVPQAAQDELRAQLAVENETKFAAAMKDVYHRVEKVVSHIAGTLKEEDPRIFDTLVTNARDLVACLPDLNLADDPLLTQLGVDLDAMLPRSAKAFKNNPELRKEVAEGADTLLAKMVGYV